MSLPVQAAGPTLASMLAAIDVASSAPLEQRHAAMAQAMASYVAAPDLLSGIECPSSQERYCRYPLYEDADRRYAVVALVWAPGQMSPVHAHHVWCALGLHRGALTEIFYSVAAGPAEPVAINLRHPGDTSAARADVTQIHRLANLSLAPAVSIHCYGVALDQMASELNLVYAAA